MTTIKKILALSSIALAVQFGDMSAEASTSNASMAITATALAECVVGATPLVFGNYSGSENDQTANVTALCTNGTTYTLALNNGTGTGATTALRNMTGPSSATLGYTIYSDSARTSLWGSSGNTVSGTGTGLLQTVTAYGAIPASQAPSPGAYTDTVTVTLTY